MEKSHVPRGKEAWEQEIFRLGVSIELQVLTAHTDAPLKMTKTAGSLRSKRSHKKKGCEEM